MNYVIKVIGVFHIYTISSVSKYQNITCSGETFRLTYDHFRSVIFSDNVDTYIYMMHIKPQKLIT